MDRKAAKSVYDILQKTYPGAPGSPHAPCRGNPFEVLILTILSAQTTDRAVLAVKKPLFAEYPDPAALAQAGTATVERIIRRLGFYHVKARYIIAAARMVEETFGGQVPDTMDDLLKIPGVGRKTANIVLYHGFGRNRGIAVDTHVRRLAQRIGFSGTSYQDRIERELMTFFPQELWGDLTDLLIAHGRAVCTARKPVCGVCPISKHCRFYQSLKKKS